MITKKTLTRQSIDELAKVCPGVTVPERAMSTIYGCGDGTQSNPYTYIEHQIRVASGLCTDGCQCYYYNENGESVCDLGTVTITGTPISGSFGGVKVGFVPAEGQGVLGGLLVTSGTYAIGSGVMGISVSSTQKQGCQITSCAKVYKDGHLIATYPTTLNPNGYYYESGGPSPLGECSFALPINGMVKVVVVVSIVYNDGTGRAAVNYEETIYENQR